jgi:SAM-dependent methyltransferase
MKKRFNNRYLSGDLPWNINRPDFNLVDVVRDYEIVPARALDIGCGTGDNVLWLARQGFTVTGIDIAEKAIDLALEKSIKYNVHADFYVRDVLKDDIPGYPYNFVFDRGCFHTFDKKKERSNYARKVNEILADSGYWLTLMGSVDDGRLDIGPPKRTAREVVTAVEPYFEIIQLKQGRFDSNDPVPSKIWICLMRKR